MTKIKLCGLTRLQDIAVVNEIRPDYIGFVFAQSRRQVTESTAKKLKAALSPGILTVGVFVNEDVGTIASLCNQTVIDLVQLHGDEDEAYINRLKKRIPNPVIKAVRVSNGEQILTAASVPCDYLLLDTYYPGQYGGSGKSFDWSVIPQGINPYFLAGGLHSGNVAQAVKTCVPYCVDISSGIETDGLKDPEKMREIVAKIRSVI